MRNWRVVRGLGLLVFGAPPHGHPLAVGLDQSPSTASAQRSTKLSLRLFLRDRLIAGDDSGDDHIATVVEGERQHRFRRWGGDRIAAAAAFHPVREVKAADLFGSAACPHYCRCATAPAPPQELPG